MTDKASARRDPRYQTKRTVRIIGRGGEDVLGKIQNVSRGGMLVEIPAELELGRTYQIEVSDTSGAFCLLGEALRIHLPPRTPEGGETVGFRVGFEFVGIDPASAERLSRILEEAAT